MLYLRKAEQLIPYHSSISLLKGKLAAYKKDTLQALSLFLRSVKNDSKNMNAYSSLIQIYLNRGKDDSALYYILQAKEVNPHQADLYYSEARIYQRKDLKQSALLSYSNCLREDSLYAPAIYQLGQIYFREGNTIGATNYFQKYIRLNDESKEVYYNLIILLTGQNNQQGTIPYYERLIQLDSTNTGLKIALQKLYKQYAVVIPDYSTPSTPIVRDTTRRQRRIPVRRDSTVVADTVR